MSKLINFLDEFYYTYLWIYTYDYLYTNIYKELQLSMISKFSMQYSIIIKFSMHIHDLYIFYAYLGNYFNYIQK